jgi:calcium/proton exchanger cax
MHRNIPELIFSVGALLQRETLIARTAFAGTILSNCLLVLGICLVVGGWDRDMETFPRVLAKTNAQMLMVALGSLVMPAAFAAFSNCKENWRSFYLTNDQNYSRKSRPTSSFTRYGCCTTVIIRLLLLVFLRNSSNFRRLLRYCQNWDRCSSIDRSCESKSNDG